MNNIIFIQNSGEIKETLKVEDNGQVTLNGKRIETIEGVEKSLKLIIMALTASQ